MDYIEECADCKHYHERWCSKAAMIGLRWADGAFAEYCLTDIAHTERIPDGMSFAQAATFSCAGVTIFHSIKKAGLKKGDVLAIIGMGALGLVGVQMAKALVSYIRILISKKSLEGSSARRGRE